MIKYLNVKAETIKVLEAHIGMSSLPWIRQYFLRYDTKSKNN